LRQKAAIIVLLLATLTGYSQIIQPVSAMVFSAPSSLPNPDPYGNMFPKLLQLQNGSVWMVWQKTTPTGGQVYLMTNYGIGWGPEILVTGNGYDNISPSIVQTDNGTIILAWSRGTAGDFNSYNIYTMSYTYKWSTPTPLVTNSPSNFDPVLARMKDGRVWVVWSRSSPTNGNGDLYYKILRNGTWGLETLVPTASSSAFEEKLPTLTQGADGRIWVCYESNINGIPQLYCTIFTGSSWTPSIALTGTPNTDKWPSITMDRSGTLWIFWAREIPNGTTSPPNPQTQYQWDIFYKNSPSNGTSWTTDASLYTNINTDEQHPSVFQGPDKKLWVVFDTCCNSPGNPYGNPNLFIAKSDIIPAHDLAVSSIVLTPFPNPRLGENATFTVTVTDLGSYLETSTLSLYVNSTLVNSVVLSIGPGSSNSFSFTWISGQQRPAKYSAIATLSPVSHELATQNNNLSYNFLLTYRGDVDRDGHVTIVDLTIVALHFGSVIGSSNYSNMADLDHNGKVNIFDMAICASEFGDLVY